MQQGSSSSKDGGGPPAGFRPPGSLLNNGRYKIDKVLNRGATAVVYAATDKQTRRQVALKVVQCGHVPINVVRREVSLSSNVAHENIVHMLDVFPEGREFVIVWELVSGYDLLDLLNQAGGRLGEGPAAFYFVQLLRAVLQMHAMGYCHRDIKPENCMVETRTQRLKLIDFGLSKHLESVATLGVGTPDYMPPEMVRSQIKQPLQLQPQQRQQQRQDTPLPPASGASASAAAAAAAAAPGSTGSHQQQQAAPPPYDAKAVDAWAMGVLLYLLVSGVYPFEDPSQPNNLAAIILNITHGRRRPLPAGVSRGCADVIAGLLNPDPRARTSLAALAHNPWLLRTAAAHAASLPAPLCRMFDAGQPSWILPVHFTHADLAAPPGTAAAAPAAAPAQQNGAASTMQVEQPQPQQLQLQQGVSATAASGCDDDMEVDAPAGEAATAPAPPSAAAPLHLASTAPAPFTAAAAAAIADEGMLKRGLTWLARWCRHA